jgi:hypothetical protein
MPGFYLASFAFIKSQSLLRKRCPQVIRPMNMIG